MDQAIAFLKELQSSPKAKELTAGMKTPESEEETARVYTDLAKKLGYSLTAEEIQKAAKVLAEEQRSKTAKAIDSMEKTPLSEDALEAVAGGEGDGNREAIGNSGCDSTHSPGEWCWFNDSCSYLIWDYSDPYTEDELYQEGKGTQEDIQNLIYDSSTPEGIQEFLYDF